MNIPISEEVLSNELTVAKTILDKWIRDAPNVLVGAQMGAAGSSRLVEFSGEMRLLSDRFATLSELIRDAIE